LPPLSVPRLPAGCYYRGSKASAEQFVCVPNHVMGGDFPGRSKNWSNSGENPHIHGKQALVIQQQGVQLNLVQFGVLPGQGRQGLNGRLQGRQIPAGLAPEAG